ncbi:hypothetical protein FBU59_002835 [Linderina macrospora]|uniref:Uncharacterized protein n=1 Tax=Linderina macrospora TaxID=4868 RepID=A0ACC1JA62_9FUNG|nr:hypothetical protein FBU59_002835 [Linderina macrospora]
MESTAGQFSRLMGIFIEQEIRHGIINTSHVEPGKLARLSQLQFQELATDVYDELNRRMNEAHEGKRQPGHVCTLQFVFFNRPPGANTCTRCSPVLAGPRPLPPKTEPGAAEAGHPVAAKVCRPRSGRECGIEAPVSEPGCQQGRKWMFHERARFLSALRWHGNALCVAASATDVFCVFVGLSVSAALWTWAIVPEIDSHSSPNACTSPHRCASK